MVLGSHPAALRDAQRGKPTAPLSCSVPLPPGCPMTCLPSPPTALQFQVCLRADLLPPRAVFCGGPVRVSNAVAQSLCPKELFFSPYSAP